MVGCLRTIYPYWLVVTLTLDSLTYIARKAATQVNGILKKERKKERQRRTIANRLSIPRSSSSPTS